MNKNKMEKKGEKLVAELKHLTQETTLKIVADGCDEFKKEYGRPMTYFEMRASNVPLFFIVRRNSTYSKLSNFNNGIKTYSTDENSNKRV